MTLDREQTRRDEEVVELQAEVARLRRELGRIANRLWRGPYPTAEEYARFVLDQPPTSG